MTPYFWECTNVPNDAYFGHGRGKPPSLQIWSAPREDKHSYRRVHTANMQHTQLSRNMHKYMYVTLTLFIKLNYWFESFNACIKGHLEPTHLKSSPLFTLSTKSLGQDSPSVHLFSKTIGSRFTPAKVKLGEDSPS